MSKITKEEVLKLARLSRLKLSDDEVEKYQHELDTIFEYVQQLASVDTTNLEPTNQVTGLVNVFRADTVVGYSAKPDELLQATPNHEGRYIKVKRMI